MKRLLVVILCFCSFELAFAGPEIQGQENRKPIKLFRCNGMTMTDYVFTDSEYLQILSEVKVSDRVVGSSYRLIESLYYVKIHQLTGWKSFIVTSEKETVRVLVLSAVINNGPTLQELNQCYGSSKEDS